MNNNRAFKPHLEQQKTIKKNKKLKTKRREGKKGLFDQKTSNNQDFLMKKTPNKSFI